MNSCDRRTDWKKKKKKVISKILGILNIVNMPSNFISDLILILQHTLIVLEMEIIYDGKALLLSSSLKTSEQLSQQIF